MRQTTTEKASEYWKKSIFNTLVILFIWFISSFGCGILFRDWCDANLPNIGTAPFGFWMSQQGSIVVFILLLISYSIMMGRLDKSLEE